MGVYAVSFRAPSTGVSVKNRTVGVRSLASLFVLGWGASPFALHAQQLRGSLIDRAAASPVIGARVVLVDATGTERGETLSAADGSFVLEAPEAGGYRIRVSRLGYRTWRSELLELSRGGTDRRFEVPVQPVPLPDLLVSAETSCPTSREERERAFRLYREAIPGLRRIVEGEGSGRYHFVLRLERPVMIWHRGARRIRYDTANALLPRPLETLPADDLARFGYARVENDTLTRFYAPHAAVLTAPSFLATHCLRVASDPDSGRVGLSFEPVPDREPVDVEGTLWLDRDAVPRRLEFRYTGLRTFLRHAQLPALEASVRSRIRPENRGYVSFVRIAVDESLFGGTLVFEELLDGLWATRRWTVRSPTLTYSSWTEAGRKKVHPRAWTLRTRGEVIALRKVEEP